MCLEIGWVKFFYLLPAHMVERLSKYIFFVSKKTDTYKQKAKETKEENRKTKETKEGQYWACQWKSC